MNNPLATFSLFICIAGGMQGALLLLALNKLFKERNVERRWLLWFIGSVSITLLGRLLYLYPQLVDIRIPVLTDLILFVYGPLYYFFVKSVFTNTSVGNSSRSSTLVHFIPAILHVAATIPIFSISMKEYIALMQDGTLFYYFILIMILAFGHNLWYWFRTLLFVRSIESKFEGDSIRFSASYVYLIKWWYLSVIACFGLVIVTYFFDFKIASIVYQFNWFAASWMTYGLGYLVLIRPEMFGDVLVEYKSYKPFNEKEKHQIEKLASELTFQLEEKRIFLDPEISLLGLAKILNTNSVMLSKTINGHFEIGFYDLINKYRVEEFIRLVKDPDNSHFTFFALAIQAGFNSKTSFNKYFKKMTKQTPKDYFRKLSVA